MRFGYMRSARQLVTKKGHSKNRELQLRVPSAGDTGETFLQYENVNLKTQQGSYMLRMLVIFSSNSGFI
jgi:hypothetical protein